MKAKRGNYSHYSPKSRNNENNNNLEDKNNKSEKKSNHRGRTKKNNKFDILKEKKEIKLEILIDYDSINDYDPQIQRNDLNPEIDFMLIVKVFLNQIKICLR